MKFLHKHFGKSTNFLVNSSIEVKEVIENIKIVKVVKPSGISGNYLAFRG